MKKIKTYFIGTPDFGAPTLKALINSESFEVLGVISQPDKKVGRKQILTKPPIKQIAEKNNIQVYQPNKISELKIEEELDLIVVVAYAQIIPKHILNFPKYGCVNVHGSLLPKHRGASCIQGAILSGDKKTGISIMKMDEGLDTGDIIHKEEQTIGNMDTTGSLFEKLSKLGGQIIEETLLKYIKGEYPTFPQDDSKSNYCPILSKKDGLIDFNKDADNIEKHIRAMSPWPGAFFELKGKTIKIIKTNPEILKREENFPGELFTINKELFLQTLGGAIKIEKIQAEGKKVMTAEEFINGYRGMIKI